MEGINLANNIVTFRHNRKITQEQLADFFRSDQGLCFQMGDKTEYAGCSVATENGVIF